MIDLSVDAETMAVIDTVLRQLYGKYNFDSYDSDDMYQEGYQIAVKALAGFKPDKGCALSTFLYGCITQRYINFIRDHSVRSHNKCTKHSEFDIECNACVKRQATQDRKRGVQRPAGLEGLDFAASSSTEIVEVQDLERKINREMPKDMREDYLLMREGSFVTRSRKEEIANYIRGLIDV